MSWQSTKLSDFLTESGGRIKHEHANELGLQRIKKIDFSANIHLDAETDTSTDMIRVKSGHLVISGINAAKGAIAVYEGDEDVLATIHYSAYEFNSDRISVDFLKWFFKSPEFSDLLKEQIPGGIKTELKPKHILPLQVKLPKLLEQMKIAERLNRFWQGYLNLEQELTHQETLLGQLQQAILQEAIQGKLTADWRAAHPQAEPARELLHRIQVEKARLIAAKKLRPGKPLPPITPAEIPFEIPKTWEWCRIGDVCKISSGKGFEKNEYSEEGVRLFQIANVSIGETSWETTVRVPSSYWDAHPDLQLRRDDLVMALNRPLLGKKLKVAILTESDIPAVLYQRVGRFDMIERELIPWMFSYLKSDCFSGWLYDQIKGVNIPFVNQSRVYTHLFPLPPLSEQAAIVERVAALQTRVRALAAELAHSRTHAAHLLQAVLQEAFTPATPPK